jgi:hypothetical protein
MVILEFVYGVVPMIGTDASREHRRRAQECVEMAAKIFDPAQRLFILEMAKVWLTLAGKIEKNRQRDMAWAN